MSQENEIEAEKLSPTTDFLPSGGASCSPSSTPETDAELENCENRGADYIAIILGELARKLERERDYWKNKRTLELASMEPLHHHEWSDGAKVKIPGKEWRLECCRCGATRQKPGSLILSENVNVEARDQ